MIITACFRRFGLNWLIREMISAACKLEDWGSSTTASNFLLHCRECFLNVRGDGAFKARASEQNAHVVAGQWFLPDDQYLLPLATGTYRNLSCTRIGRPSQCSQDLSMAVTCGVPLCLGKQPTCNESVRPQVHLVHPHSQVLPLCRSHELVKPFFYTTKSVSLAPCA